MSPIGMGRIGLQLVQRRYFIKKVRPFQERMRQELNMHRDKRLVMARRKESRPVQFEVPQLKPNPDVLTKERKLPSLEESRLPYAKYSEETVKKINEFGTFYDPLFNPHLPDERNRVNPDEEPFNAIYSDSQSQHANDYTGVRDVTTPDLWSCVERLAKLKIAPEPIRRKAGEPPTPLPSGFVPPPEQPPDLPYFVARTRNHLLPVYYRLHSDPNECVTMVKQVDGDLWKFEEDLRSHLEENFSKKNSRILTSVSEPDGLVMLRGRWLHQTVDWLHAQGF